MNKSDKYLRIVTIAGTDCIFTAVLLMFLLLSVVLDMAPLKIAFRVFFITLCAVHLLALLTFIVYKMLTFTICKIRMVSIEKKELKELEMAMRKRHREQTKAKIFGKR